MDPNIRSYAVGKLNGNEIVAFLDGHTAGLYRKDSQGTYILRWKDETLPEAIEAGKAYLLANGGEVYPDGDDKDKRIEELYKALGCLVRLIENTPNGYESLVQGQMSKNIFDNAKKALEIKQ